MLKWLCGWETSRKEAVGTIIKITDIIAIL
jgi:hypothetical protein